ncbi:hypothetical protein NEOLEDRAFT_1244312 [Neolentinus lepideus HHB14362 ss-1]|uniref:Cyclin N-terminal domain-containing protein n=1 Tax=Neolentinus lepideus HHB14362 ss-1 TaxID=1314782 RepID=A0A165Q342_9AGAM|nr:hypothetical protein NEOLEDRAFT_1244312 [Neolentinus lepideus HHB14362 ss-1]
MASSTFASLHTVLEELKRIDPPIEDELLDDGFADGYKSAEGWLLEYTNLNKEPAFVKRVAAVLISFTENYYIFHPYPPYIIAMGALMLARHLCGTGRGPPIGESEQALEVMAIIDRTLGNEHSLMPEEIYSLNPKSSHWEILHRLDEFYEDWREDLGPVPRTLELYLSSPTAVDYRAGRAKRPTVTLMHFPDRI